MKETLRLIRFNIRPILMFELMYKLSSAAILSPFVYFMINSSIKMAKISMLSTRTVKEYFRTPTTLLMIFAILLFFAIYSFINISALLIAIEASYRRRKISVITMFVRGVKNSLRLLKIKNIPMILYLLLILPITNSIMISGTIIGIRIPEFMLFYIKRNSLFFIMFLLIYFTVSILAMLRIFNIMYFVLQEKDFKECNKLSKKSVKKASSRKIIIGIIFWNAFITLFVHFIEGAITSVVAKILKTLISNQSAYFVINSFIRISMLIIFAITMIVVTPIIYAYICNGYYKIVGDVNYDSKKHRESRDVGALRKEYLWNEKRVKRKEKIIIISMLVIGIVLNGIYIILGYSGIVDLDILFEKKVKIAAHRGESRNAPENTIAAFRVAIESQADVIELDVRQTKDGEIVVLHDENIKRICGVDKKIGDITYEELSQLSAGAWYGEEFEDERVPTLRDAIKYCKGVVDLNIELKPSKSDVNLEEEVVKLVEEYDLYKDCVVASLDYDTVTKVKLLDDKIKTVYVMSMAFGSFEEYKYADAFSIRYSFISEQMVKRIHKQNKEVYAWTVNNKDRVLDLMQKRVDCIITDKPYDMKKVVYEESSGMLIDWIEGVVGGY